MSKNYPELSSDDSRNNLLEDLAYGGLSGYAHARGIAMDFPSTLEFEEAVLRDVLNRATAIAYDEADGAHSVALKKYQEAAIESFRLADWVFENIPVKDIPAEYGIKMNTVYEMLSNLGIEVEG
jgi:hypothetical protein